MTTDSGLYVPDGPYIFKSGKRQGKCLEILMFDDYKFVNWLYNLLNKKSHYNENTLHEHINWLIPRGKDRRAAMICPQCNSSVVQFYSIIGENGYTARLDFTACEKVACKEALRLHRLTRILPITWPSLLCFSAKKDRKFVANVFWHIFGLPERRTKEAAFEFFCK